MRRKKADLQAEIDRLTAALEEICTVCMRTLSDVTEWPSPRQAHSLAEWPQAVGEIHSIARGAVGIAGLLAKYAADEETGPG